MRDVQSVAQVEAKRAERVIPNRVQEALADFLDTADLLARLAMKNLTKIRLLAPYKYDRIIVNKMRKKNL